MHILLHVPVMLCTTSGVAERFYTCYIL